MTGNELYEFLMHNFGVDFPSMLHIVIIEDNTTLSTDHHFVHWIIGKAES